MARGGRRSGSGRKPKLTTIIREKAIKEANGDAEYALGLIVAYMRDDQLLPNFRKSCAEMVMDRVWGKPTQHSDDTVTVTAGVTIYLPDNGRENTSDPDAG